MLEGFRASLNYYRIKTDDAINQNGQSLVDAGAVGFVFASRFNTAEVLTDGLEYEISYRKEFSEHRFDASLGVNQILTYEVLPEAGSERINFLDRLAHPLVPNESVQGPGSLPEYKGYARLVWSYQNLTMGGTVNYIHSMDDNPLTTIDGLPREIDSWTSLDLVAQYNWSSEREDWLSGTTLTASIDNVTDEEPPFASGAFADVYDSSLYSLEERVVAFT